MAKKTLITRDVTTGRFVLGRESFAKITAVEGIKMPRSMREEFKRLDASAASRSASPEIKAPKKKTARREGGPLPC